MATVIDVQTQTDVTSSPTPTTAFGVVPTMYVSGANLPALGTPYQPATRTEGRGRAFGGPVFQLTGQGDLQHLEALAFDAAQALREWFAHDQSMWQQRSAPDMEMVKGFVHRVVNDGDGLDGITAWCLLDGDQPSSRTITEYRGSTRDVLLWLAGRGISPAEAGSEDMKAYKAYLHADGAPAQMERMRAAWYGREPRIGHRNDWRGPVALVAKNGYVHAQRDMVKAQTAKLKSDKRSAASLGRLVMNAEQAAQRWLASLLSVVATYAHTPRQETCGAYTPDTVSLRITLARNFFKMALSRQAVGQNPLLEIKVAKGGTSRSQKIISRFFSDDEVLAVLDLCDEAKVSKPRDKAAAARDAAIIRLARNQGLRISEISNLDLSNFNPTAGEFGTLSLLHAKGNKSRMVLLTEKTRASLDGWLLWRAMLNPNNDAMFVTLNWGTNGVEPGARIAMRSVRSMFDDKQNELGMKQPGRSVHGLRHSYATRAMMEDESQLISLSLSMGHSTPTITMGYVEASQLIKKNPAKLSEI